MCCGVLHMHSRYWDSGTGLSPQSARDIVVGDAKRRDVIVERRPIIVWMMGPTDQGQETSFSMAGGVQWGLVVLYRSLCNNLWVVLSKCDTQGQNFATICYLRPHEIFSNYFGSNACCNR
jgi:hypothetical protein